MNDAADHRPRRGGRVSSAAEYDPVANADLAVSVTDDDTAGLTVTAADPFAVGEGASATYTVKLNTQPSGDVVISLTVSGSSEVTVADTDGETAGVQNTLTFTASDWDTPQTVTVEAAQDDDAMADAATIAHAVVDVSSAAEYDPVANVALSVSVTDDDTAGITLSALAAITEGSSGTYTVKLASQPSADVVISLTVSGSSEVTIADTDTVMTGVQNTLTFTSSDWDAPQTVTVNAGEDDDAVNDAATIAHAVVDASSAAEYDPVANVDLAVSVTDDDSAGESAIVVSTMSIRAVESAITEGQDAKFTITAQPAPREDKTVIVAVSGGRAFGVADGDHQITIPASWASAELSLPTTDDRRDEPNGTIIARIQASTAYRIGTPASASVAVRDNDKRPPPGGSSPDPVTPIIAIAASASPVVEGSDATFTITANPAPASRLQVVVKVSGGEGFTDVSGNNAVQLAAGAATASLTLATKDDAVDEQDDDIIATIQPLSGYDIGPTGDSASITVIDNDAVPGAPIGLRVLPGDGHVELDWTAPTYHGSSGITHYTAEYSSYSDFRATLRSDTVGAATVLTIGDLTNGREYHFRVRAANVVGHGDWSASATGTPMAVPSPGPTPEPTPTPTVVLEPTPTPTVVLEPTPTPTVVLEPTPTPTVVLEPTPTPTVVLEPTPTPTVVLDPTPTPTVVLNPTPTPTVVLEPTPTPTVVLEPTPTPTVVLDPTPTPTAVPEPTLTHVRSRTPVAVLAPMSMPVLTPTLVAVPETPIPTPSDIASQSPEEEASQGRSCWFWIIIAIIVLISTFVARRLLRRRLSGQGRHRDGAD